MPDYLYHYTNRDGLDGILDLRRVLTTLQKAKDAFHGEGVYLTSLSPTLGKKIVDDNNWNGKGGDKADYYLKFDAGALIGTGAYECPKAERRQKDVWLHPTDIDIEDSLVTYGPTERIARERHVRSSSGSYTFAVKQGRVCRLPKIPRFYLDSDPEDDNCPSTAFGRSNNFNYEGRMTSSRRTGYGQQRGFGDERPPCPHKDEGWAGAIGSTAATVATVGVVTLGLMALFGRRNDHQFDSSSCKVVRKKSTNLRHCYLSSTIRGWNETTGMASVATVQATII